MVAVLVLAWLCAGAGRNERSIWRQWQRKSSIHWGPTGPWVRTICNITVVSPSVWYLLSSHSDIVIFYSERSQPQVVRVEPQVGSVAYKKDSGDVSSPSRPSSLPMQSNNQSEPIPVPTQVKAYERIRSSSSPLSSPRKCGTEPSPLDSAKVWQLFLFYLSVKKMLIQSI